MIKRTTIYCSFLIALTGILCALLALSGCSEQNEIPNSGKGVAIVRFNIAGLLDGDSQTISRSKNISAISETQAINLDNEMYMTATLEEDIVSTTRATKPLADNVKYRIIAYDNSGNYRDHADFTVGSGSDVYLTLDGNLGTTYTLVAYSYNSTTTLPETTPATGTATTLSGTKLANVPAGTDLLYWTGTKTVYAGDNTVDITFNHLFSQINVSGDAATFTSSDNTIYSVSGITLSPSYSADMTLSNGTLASNGTAGSVTITGNTPSTPNDNKLPAGNYSIIYTAGNKVTVNFASITIGSTTYTNRSLTFGTVLVAGKKYTLNAVFKNIATLPSGSGTLVGRPCIDVQETEGGTAAANTNRGGLAQRLSEWNALAPPAISGNSSKNSYTSQPYIFTSTTDVSNVRFVYVNTNGTAVSAISGGNIATVSAGTQVVASVTFDQMAVVGKRRSDNVSTTLYAIYNEDGVEKKTAFTVIAQDQGCCGANTASNTWTTFMCHNMGTTYSAYPFAPSQGLHGAKYMFGAKNPTLTAADDQTYIGSNPGGTTWSTHYYQTGGSWNTANDPCPEGWRLPSINEWANVIANNNHSTSGIWYYDTDYSAGYSAIYSFGKALFLPIEGFRDNNTGELKFRDEHAYYWSSTDSGGNYLYFDKTNLFTAYTNHDFGFSVRCLAE